jgi:PBP1b-binding outer membrane lipoprotein LpoB
MQLREDIMKTLLVIVAMVLAGCTQPAPFVPTVNGQPATQMRTCDSYVGQVLTKADATGSCTYFDGITTVIQPANYTICDNGTIYIIISETVSGTVGHPAIKGVLQPIDPTTCEAAK